MLGQISGEQAKDRSERAILSPWLSYLWTSYRLALDLLIMPDDLYSLAISGA